MFLFVSIRFVLCLSFLVLVCVALFSVFAESRSQTGVSFLLVVLGAVALCIAAVYLRASTLHEREIKISVGASVASEAVVVAVGAVPAEGVNADVSLRGAK